MNARWSFLGQLVNRWNKSSDDHYWLKYFYCTYYRNYDYLKDIWSVTRQKQFIIYLALTFGWHRLKIHFVPITPQTLQLGFMFKVSCVGNLKVFCFVFHFKLWVERSVVPPTRCIPFWHQEEIKPPNLTI
jgi:hypothetical protein